MSEDVRIAADTEPYIARYFALPQMFDLLRSLQRPLPHLTFGPWEKSTPPRRGEYGDITVFRHLPDEVRVRIRLAPGAGIASKVRTLAGLPVPRMDREALRSFADFAGTLVESLGVVSRNAAFHRRSTEILPANIDIGSLAVGRYLRSAAHLPFDPTPILLHLRGLSQQTYEGQNICYGMVLTKKKGGIGQFPSDVVPNKRYRAVSDGTRTALRLDRDSRVLGLVSLPQEDGPQGRAFRPSMFDSLAAGSARDLLGLGLSFEGDIVCLQKSNMIVSLRQGVWQVWNHAENVSVLRRAIASTVTSKKVKKRTASLDAIARVLYTVALDLSFDRRGALFVVVEDARTLPALIDDTQRPGNPARATSDLGLDLTLLRRNRNVTKLPRDVLDDLAGLDGAVILGSNGNVLAYGAVIKLAHDRESSRGARAQACLEASKHGVAVMVSSDGAISIVAKEKVQLYL